MLVFFFRFWVLNCLEFRLPFHCIGSRRVAGTESYLIVSRYKLDIIVASNCENLVTKTAENNFDERCLFFFLLYWC